MSFYGDKVLPRFVDVVLGGRQYSDVRSRVASGLDGEVLEIGFGSGLNVPHYPAAVRRIRAIDPATLGRRLAADRIAASQVPVEFVDLDRTRLPLEEESVDHILVTWTMCTIPEIDDALSEMLRVLRPDGLLHFAEHGLSSDPAVAGWQHRLTPLQRRLAGGCHLDRPIDELIAQAGFHTMKMETYYLKGPKAFGHMFEGLAAKA